MSKLTPQVILDSPNIDASTIFNSSPSVPKVIPTIAPSSAPPSGFLTGMPSSTNTTETNSPTISASSIEAFIHQMRSSTSEKSMPDIQCPAIALTETPARVKVASQLTPTPSPISDKTKLRTSRSKSPLFPSFILPNMEQEPSERGLKNTDSKLPHTSKSSSKSGFN
ncbi:unnamed protein product [Meganyctiphanes norvegica]|uniref:Uncharacterized protein n=1 Tax=Meganyctiphanes norvegica TaxID=48144 RepID=A0AAV2PY58_MEGNR